jgi:hypothetical protein
VNNQQAKDRLMLYRRGHAEEEEPDIREALAAAKQDPELGRWFEEHCAVQEALRAKFRQIPVPEGLKEQILSERKAHTTPGFPRRALPLAATVAALLLLAGVAGLYLRPVEDLSYSGFRQRMAKYALRDYPRMDLTTSDPGQIRRFLVQKGHGDYVLPASLESRAASTGCALLRWQNKPVTMICFNSGGGAAAGEPDLFLFIVARSGVPNAPQPGPPQFSQINRLAAASWSAGDNTYVLETLGEEALLRKFL